ncbi:hypothetical protein CGLO_10943 [Colletotrichum gloeosporioides Cg-14]|uniref:FAD-binding oxidoreductase/transferase type 4 C-terminal domain-containing protein n=1 Tax=Colletotrichum gloeosporioides (strain Cg-14) TaxID=1237896 RepID=T0KC61_COLGC|nr:hypothetical protein CGLO_10943 [Colletotrichum gloeosporioides Cg-14]
MLCLYENLEEAAASVSAIIAERIIPATLEFMDQPTLEVVEDFAKIGLPTDVQAVLLIEQDGHPEAVARDMQSIAKICQQYGAKEVNIAHSEEEAKCTFNSETIRFICPRPLKPDDHFRRCHSSPV